jgi:phage-related protein
MPLILVKLKVVFAAIAGAAAPIVVIMAGIALAIYTVIRNFDKLKAYAMQCFERIKAAFGVSSESADKFTAVLETAKKALGIVMGILEGGMLFAIKTVMNAITSAIQMVIGAIMIWVNVAKLGLWPIITIIKVIIGLFTGGLPGALDALEGQFAKLGEIFSGIFGGFKVILGGVIGLFTGLFKDGIEFVKNIFGLFGADVAGIFNTAKEAIKSAFTGVIDWVKTNWKSIALFIINPFAGVFKYLYDNFEGFRNVVNNVVSAIKGFFEKGIDFIKNIIGGLPEPFQNVFTGIKIIIDGFIGFWKNAFSAGSNAIEAIVNLLPNLFSDPIGTIKAIIGEAVTFFKTVFQGGIDAVKGIIDGFADRFGGVFVSIKEKIGGFVNFFKDRMEPVKDFFSGIGEKIGGLFGKGKAADIAAHAGGGIFTHRHIAEIAEKGAEAVVPLNKSPQGFDIWKRAGELGGYLKKASEQSPAISAATPPAKPPEPSPVMAAAAQRISSGDTVVNVEFRMTNNFNGGTPDGETAKRISEAGQQAADDFETRVKIAIENIMNNQRRTSFA